MLHWEFKEPIESRLHQHWLLAPACTNHSITTPFLCKVLSLSVSRITAEGDITDHNHTISHPSRWRAVNSHEIVKIVGEKLGVTGLKRGEVRAPRLKLQ